MNNNKINLALLAGGKSGERDVSLKGAEGFLKSIDRDKYNVIQYDPATDLAKLAAEAKNIDVAFILLHGLWGEDGTVQGFLDLLGIPYQGSGVLGSAAAMDKNIAKILYRNAGLPVPRWTMAQPSDASSPKRILSQIRLPLVIKPVCQGSSIGMSIAHSESELCQGISEAFKHDKTVLVEEFVAGREITVGVIGNDLLEALPVVEIIPGEGHPFFNYEAKYTPGATREICPADLPEDVALKAQEYGLVAHRALSLRGYSRTDMIINDDGIQILETNTIPGMTPTSLLPQAAAAAGLPFAKLIDRLIELALEK